MNEPKKREWGGRTDVCLNKYDCIVDDVNKTFMNWTRKNCLFCFVSHLTVQEIGKPFYKSEDKKLIDKLNQVV